MKAKLACAITLACAAIQLTAMPTEEETKQAEPVVQKLMAPERAAYKSGKKTRSEVAAAAMKLAGEADTDAAELLLMKGAFVLYVRDGNLEKAVETMNALEAAISDMPPQSVTNMIEAALLGVPRKEDGARLYKLLDESKKVGVESVSLKTRTHVDESTTETKRKAFAKLFPGWQVSREAAERIGIEQSHRGQDNVAFVHPPSQQTPAVVSRTLTLSKENPCLFLKMASFNEGSDFLLSVLVNGKEVLPKRLICTPDYAPWQDITVPLFAWRGSKVKIEVVLAANNWWCEYPFFKRLEIAEGNGQEKFVSNAKETVDGYTWSYRVDNGEAAIIAEDGGRFACALSPEPTGAISIPSTLGCAKVTSIGRGAFSGCKGLKSVVIPSEVISIGQNAFFDCHELESVTLPPNVMHIENGAFRSCKGLTSVTIPASVTSINGAAFCDTGALTAFQVESGNRFYKSENGLLLTKDGMTLVHGVNGDVTIPSSVTAIGPCAFEGCIALRSVSIPSGLKNIDAWAFKNCRGVSSVTLPISVTNIGYQAFWGCGLTSITIPDGVANIAECAFFNCANLVSVTLPSSLKGIERGAFAFCRGLKAVTLPDGLTKIDANAFMWCMGLKSVEIPSEVKDVGDSAFERCINLESVTICGEVPNKFKDVFKDCGKLKSIHVPANAKSWAGMKDWLGIPLVFDAEAAESRREPLCYMIVDLDKSGKDAVSYLDDVPKGGWSDEYRTKKIAFRRIEPGSFEYLPGKSFKITKPFYIGVFEVTQKQYEMVMKENPSEFKGDMRPVENVSYIDIRGGRKGFCWPEDNKVDDDSYLGKLRKRIGLEFDIPTEVQWEYACRAGTKGDLNVDGVEMVKLGKCRDNGGMDDQHVKVGSFLPNAWGLYDMHGNVWEWCLDRVNRIGDWPADAKETDPKGPAEGLFRVRRSGCMFDSAHRFRSSLRGPNLVDAHCNFDGFRLACPAESHPMKLFPDEKLRELKIANGNVGAKGKTKMASSGKETIDGVEWSYRIIDGLAQVDYASSSNVTGSITIPSTLGGCPVTSIGRNEFRSCGGWRVFRKCCNMMSVSIPQGVMNIGDSAFFGCSNMVSVTIPSSVTNIARCAFSRCDRLSSVVVDEENVKYSSRNGMLCSKDGSTLIAGVNGDVTIPTCVKNIEDWAFQGRSGLKTVIVPSSVTSIGIFAFSDCRGLKTVAIPASVTKIGWYAFSGCSGLKSFSVDPDNPSYSERGGMLCSEDGATLIAGVNGDVTIPSSVKEIGWYAFSNYDGLKSVRMPENVISIAQGAFKYCGSLTSVTFSSRTASIEAVAFYSCKKLVSVTIPSSVTKIERSAFSCCNELMSFTVDQDNPSYSSRNGLLCSKDGSMLVAGVTGDVAIPSNVKNIGDEAFSGCTGLTSVTIPSSVTNIGYQAFDECEGLTSVEIPSSVKNIGERAFTMCYKIKSVTIPEGVTSIGKYAFAWCRGIDFAKIPHGVTSIGECAFADCRGLKSVSVPTSVASIGDNAFCNCSGLTSMTIPSSVNSIGIGAFYGCSALKTVSIPSSVASIGRKAFDKTQFYDDMPNGMVILGGGVLYGYKGECPSSVTIPSNVTSIGWNAFRGCSGLETLTISSTVTDIDGQAFAECPNLKSVRVVSDGNVETMSFEDFFKGWKNVVAQRLKKCEFLLTGQFKKDAKVYLCLSASYWDQQEMSHIAKIYAEKLLDDPGIELVLFVDNDQDAGAALAWGKEQDVKFPMVKSSIRNLFNLRSNGIVYLLHLFVVRADGTLMEDGAPMKMLADEKLRELKSANGDV